MRRAQGLGRWAITWALPMLMSACAGVTRDASMPVSDPNEGLNRQVLAANQQVLRPVSEAVKTVVPGPIHDRLHDLNSHLKEPRILVNDSLQGRFEAAAHTAGRFVVIRPWDSVGLSTLRASTVCRSRAGISARPCLFGGSARDRT